MSKPSYNKDLPEVPSPLRPSRGKAFSERPYIKLLEQEVEHLQLLNSELQKELDALQTKYNIETDRKRRSDERAFRYNEKIHCRDKLVAEIAGTIINEFQRYKDALRDTEEITVYSSFTDSDGSPV